MDKLTEIKKIIDFFSEKSIFTPNINALNRDEWEEVINIFYHDYRRYYNDDYDLKKIKYYPGLLSTFFYRISRVLFLKGDEINALEFSSLGFSLTGIEIYYSSKIGKALKINHGIGTIIGSRTEIGDNVLLHHSITIGEKNGGRARIGNNVTIYPGAILVGEIFIGDNSIVGANVFVDKNYPERSKII